MSFRSICSISALLFLIGLSCSVVRTPGPQAEPEARITSGPGPLLGGSASVEITPSKPAYLAGAGLGRKSTRVNDKLYARCLVLSNSEITIGVAALDLIGFFYSDVEPIRGRLGNDFEHLIIAATHNHSGPDVLGLWGLSFLRLFPIASGRDEVYVHELKDKIVTCLHDAKAHMQRVTLRFNRRIVQGFSTNIRRGGMKDDELTVMQMRASDSGDTLAILYNFAAHPEIFLQETMITADFPYWVNEAIEQRLGGRAIFLNGAIGCLVTVDLGKQTPGVGETSQKPTIEDAERVSRRLSEAVIEAVETARSEVTEASMILHRRRLYLPVENWRFRLARRMGFLAREEYDGTVKTELSLLELGPAQMVTVPGEICPEIGMAMKAKMRAPFKFLVGLGNDELGYILRPTQFSDPVYGYERTMSIGPEAAVIEGELLEMLPGE